MVHGRDTDMITEMKSWYQEIGSFVVGGVLGAVILGVGLWWMSLGKVMPGVKVAGEEMGGKSQEEVKETLQARVERWKPGFSYGEVELELPTEVAEFAVEETAKEAVGVGKSLNVREWGELLRGEVELPIEVTIREEAWGKWLEELKLLVEIPGKPGSVKLVGKEIVVTNGADAVLIEESELRERVQLAATRAEEKLGELPTKLKRMGLSEQELEELKTKLGRLVGDKLVIRVDEERATLDSEGLLSLMAVEPERLASVDGGKVLTYIEGLSERYDRPAQDARLAFVGGKVEEFAPAREGIEISKREAVGSIMAGVEQLLLEGEEVAEVELAVVRTPPKVSTEEVNNLGIVERIGKGESYYAHSIPNRVYNVGLASKRVSGALVAPGEEFSFNQAVGEISQATGYRTAYVISNGRTELGDGGGVCQVSTTVFRAALNAGLPITERWAHAYRVGYYEQNAKPGLDATIYSPSKDLKFVNDTPGHILVQAIVDEPNRHLTIEIYGTKDGRVALLSPVRVWGESPPPPDLYQDDPSLPAGVVKQVDWSAWGAKTAFDYRVERGGETIYSKTFSSNFRPWQNVFLRGTGEAVTQ